MRKGMFHIPFLSLAQGLLSNPLPLQFNEFVKPSFPLFYNYIHINFGSFVKKLKNL
jgi:hypothetical protein